MRSTVLRFIAFGSVACLAVAAFAQTRPARDFASSPDNPAVLPNADVADGQTVIDPFEAGLRFRVAGPWRPEDRGKLAGLFFSRDGGETWHVLSQRFDFVRLFVHPLTGRLFAIVDYRWLETGPDGFLGAHSAYKILVSDDGQRWKDITRGPGYALLATIEQDPEFPNRVKLTANGIRPYILRYDDDAFTSWHDEPFELIEFLGLPFQPTTRPAGAK